MASDRYTGANSVIEALTRAPMGTGRAQLPYRPHDYQKEAIKFMLQHNCAGLFLDPGLGKTSITLKAFQLLKQRGLVKRMLVIAPLRPALSVWPGESQKWDDFRSLKVAVLHGPNRLSMLLNPEIDVHIINPEGLDWLFVNQPPDTRPGRGQDRSSAASKLSEWWDMLVVDESTRFKHTNTKRFKILRPQLEKFRRRYILTGSPAPNGLLDLFGQVYILDQGASLGRYITHYRMNYFDKSGFGGYTYTPKSDAEERIQKRIAPLIMRLSAEDYLTLPPLVENTIKIDLPDEAKRVYKQMEELLIAQVVRGMVTAPNASAATIKCRQIANGGIFHDGEDATGKRLWSRVHDAKTETVAEIVEELQGQPALVAYEFQHDLDRLREAFPEAPYLGGGVSANRQREIEEAWNTGALPILLAQPQSVAHGLNLQGVGAAVIWHSLTWDLELYEQFIRRVWRQGQEKRVVVHHVVASGTVDEAVMDAIYRKDRTQRGLMDALKSYIKRA